MRLVRQSVQVLPYTSVSKDIERVARISYKSEDKIEHGSDEVLTRKLIKRGHYSTLEFGRSFSFIVDREELNKLVSVMHERKINSSALNQLNIYKLSHNAYAITANLRTYRCLLVELRYTRFTAKLASSLLDVVPSYLIEDVLPNVVFEEGFKQFIPEIRADFEMVGTVTFLLRVNRGVTHEIVRHRKLSFLQESTRFVNYGSDHISFILPPHTNVEEGEYRTGSYVPQGDIADSIWFDALIDAEYKYTALIKKGWSPQQARGVLPIELKADIAIKGTIVDWDEFIVKRDIAGAHPQMREVAIRIKEQVNNIKEEFDGTN